MRSLRCTWSCYLTLTELSSRLKISDCLLQTHYAAALAPVPLWTQLPSPGRGHMHFCKTARWTSWSTQSLPYSKNATERRGSSTWLWGKLVSREKLDYISCPSPWCEMCSHKSTPSLPSRYCVHSLKNIYWAIAKLCGMKAHSAPQSWNKDYFKLKTSGTQLMWKEAFSELPYMTKSRKLWDLRIVINALFGVALLPWRDQE